MPYVRLAVVLLVLLFLPALLAVAGLVLGIYIWIRTISLAYHLARA